jgi:hypothetical protein
MVDGRTRLLQDRGTGNPYAVPHRAVASYNGDFVIHFRHPTWRDDQNDPASATRVNGRKVR